MSLSITTISVSLATFVGMLLGLRRVNEEIQKGVAEASAVVGGRAAAALPRLQDVAQSVNPNMLQGVAAASYIISLVFALYFWWRGGRDTDPSISKLGQSLLGLIGGALAVILNTNQ
jgi:hypothetical protein